MDELVAGGSAMLDGHADGVEDQLGAQVVGHSPADDAAGVGVDHDGEVEESFPGAQVGDIGDPQPVRCGGGELPLDQVRRGRGSCGLAARLAASPAVGALNAGQAHQSRHRLAVPPVTTVVEFGGEPAGAVDASVLRPGLPGDLDALFVVAFPVSGMLPAGSEPLVEGAVADAEQAAEQTDRVGGLLRVDEPVHVGPVHRSVSRAKKTAAFFKSPSPAPAGRPDAATAPVRPARPRPGH